MKRFWLENGLIYFNPLDSEVREVGELKNADIQDDILILGNMAIPIDMSDEIYVEWNKLYPNGKVVDVVDSKPHVTEEQKLRDMVDFLMKQYIQNEVKG